MKADKRFADQPLSFWANVRAISETVGYTQRKTKTILVPTAEKMREAMRKRGLRFDYLFCSNGKPTSRGKLLQDYFEYRAKILNDEVQPRLMKAERAKEEFSKLKKKLSPRCPLPMNKQKGEKKAPAFLTGIVNMIVEANSQGIQCDFDPRQLTSFTRNGIPLRALARRVDGAFPTVNNPIALWEIKEYYYTTTFGSCIADGVYETLLDGMELEELRKNEKIETLHYLIIDAYETWWEKGRSYLCRIIDALSMGYIDEVLFGYEVIEKLPSIVQEWVKIYRAQNSAP